MNDIKQMIVQLLRMKNAEKEWMEYKQKQIELEKKTENKD